MNLSPVKKSMIASMCIALCVVLTQAFHVIKLGDMFYGPINMPVLLCSLLCGWKCGVLCALAGLTLSTAVSGVPSLVWLPVLMAECLISALVCGLFTGKIREPTGSGNLSVTLLVSMLSGRVVGALLSALLFARDGLSPIFWIGGYLAAAMPGMIVLLVLLPFVMDAVRAAGLLPSGEEMKVDIAENESKAASAEENLTFCEES